MDAVRAGLAATIQPGAVTVRLPADEIARIELAEHVEGLAPAWRAGLLHPAALTFSELQEYLVPGTYNAVGESDEGTYYLGPSPCLAEIFVPKDAAVPPKNAVARNYAIFQPRAAAALPNGVQL